MATCIKLQLHHLANSSFSYSSQHNIDLHQEPVQRIPRELHSEAAISLAQSRIVMIGTLPPTVLIHWNSCEVLIHWIVSRYWTASRCLFSVMGRENCLAVSLVGVITRVFSYISLQNVSVILVVSEWPSICYFLAITMATLCYDNCCHGRTEKSLICSIHWNGCLIFAVRLVSVHSKLKKYWCRWAVCIGTGSERTVYLEIVILTLLF